MGYKHVSRPLLVPLSIQVQRADVLVTQEMEGANTKHTQTIKDKL